MHQFPAVLISSVSVTIAERRHAGKAHAIFNNPKYFAIRQILRVRTAQVRRLGIKAATDDGLAAAIVAVANRAVIGEMQPRVAQVFG